ncbi:MAG: Gx transporter family protein [Bacillota bacterium]|nr:Gx transporter family protein [Bacillota bacterium]NLJ03889.1 Gx transporter family protein [Bacillota bacterium]
MSFSHTRRVVYLGLATGLALGLHLFEAMIPMPTDIMVPGVKLGLANIVTLYVIMNFGTRDGIVISILRTLLGSLFSGTFMTPTFYFSFTGGVVSAIVMGLLYRFASKHLSMMGISLVGAVTHNVAQLSIAALMIEQELILLYLPVMLFAALPTGAFVGLVTGKVHKHFAFHKG